MSVVDRVDCMNCKPTKQQIKKAFTSGEIEFPDAIPLLVYDHEMEYRQAVRYLMEIEK
jgi:hypothetical protein